MNDIEKEFRVYLSYDEIDLINVLIEFAEINDYFEDPGYTKKQNKYYKKLLKIAKKIERKLNKASQEETNDGSK